MYSDLDNAHEGQSLNNGSPYDNNNNNGMNPNFPTNKLFFGMKKTALVKYVWTWNTGMLLPFFISGCATAGGEFPGGVVFSFIFVTFIAIAVSLFGYQIMLKPEFRSDERYGMLLASVFFMTMFSFNEAVDAGSFNRNFYQLLGVNLPAVRATIAFAVFLFLGYLVALFMLYNWKEELEWNDGSSSRNLSDLGRSFDSIHIDNGDNERNISVPDLNPNNNINNRSQAVGNNNVANDEYLETEL